MKHPESFILLVLVLADHFLTLIGETQRVKKYSEHFTIEHYELNPAWQESVAQKKWFDPKHILLTITIIVLLMLVVESSYMPELFAQGLLGALLVCFGSVVGRHLGNLLTFRHINRTPNEVSGQVSMTHALLLSLSLYQLSGVLVPVALVAALSPTPFAIGGVFGVVLLLIVHLQWIRKYRGVRKLINKPEVGASQ